MDDQNLKSEVARYWNKASCGTDLIREKKFSREYFEKIEAHRYLTEPEIFSFAQFSRFHKAKILEVGMGAGTDFLQWVRAGAHAYGIDLTHEAIENVQRRLDLYGLKAEEIQIGDAENLPYDSNQFDLVYSWGVIHHSPDTQKCLSEIVRVTKPGGTIKIMIYNRRSLYVFYRYLRSVLKGKPFRSFANVLFHDVESLGTKAYTFKEVLNMTQNYPVSITQLKATATSHDLLHSKSKPLQFLAYLAATLCGWNQCGFYMTLELKKQ